MNHKKRIIISLFTLLLTMSGWGTIQLPAIFSDGMVLQQNSEAAFWGWADPGESVTIKPGWGKKEVTTSTDKNGRWMLHLKTPSYGGPYIIDFKGSNHLTLKNVLIGEVWLCSGQSNMAFTVKGAANAKTAIATASYPQIRYFSVKRQYGPKRFNDAVGSTWVETNPENVAGFSAVAYFFAKKIFDELKIPVGIIYTAWGGTPAEAWTPGSILANDKKLSLYYDRWQKIVNKVGQDSALYYKKLNDWNEARKTSDSALAKKPSEPQTLYYFKRPWREPAVLFNGMINPVIPYSISGVLWYQGESNVNYADEYYDLFSAMIKSWRTEWNRNLPFYFVQIAPNGYANMDAAARLREAQYKVSKNIPNTAMAATADVGNIKNIHPTKKQEVGERLAYIALAKNYGKRNVVYKGPEVISSETKNDKVYLAFNQSIKIPTGQSPASFEIGYRVQQNDSLVFIKAQAKLEKNKIVVWIDGVDEPVMVRYAWLLANKGNIFNAQGLPAYPFRIKVHQ